MVVSVKANTKDGKVPVTARFEQSVYTDLKKYAFLNDMTPNKAISFIVSDYLRSNYGSGDVLK